MKGYDVRDLPARGRADADRAWSLSSRRPGAPRWTADVRPFPFYRPGRPASARGARAGARAGAAAPSAIAGASASSSRRERRRPTAWSASRPCFWSGWFDGFGAVASEVVDASPLLARARMIKTAQELERMRLAERDRSRRDGARARQHPPRDARERGRRDVRGARARQRHRLSRARSSSRARSRSSGRGRASAPSPRPATGRCSPDEPTLLEIWVCADGYWCGPDQERLSRATLRREYDELLDGLLGGLRRRGRRTCARARASPSSTC